MGEQSDAFFSPGDVMRRLREVEAELEQVRRERRLERAAIGSGGLTVKDGGQIQVLDAAGNVITTLDVDGATIHEADGSVLIKLDGTGLRLNDGVGTKLIDLTTAGLRAFENDGSILAVLNGSELRFNNAAGNELVDFTAANGVRIFDSAGNKLLDLSTNGLRAFETDGSTLLVLDGSRLRFNRSDGSRSVELTPSGGLQIFASDGVTVRAVLDEFGLQVNDDTGERTRIGDIDHAGDFGIKVTDASGNVIFRRSDAGTWRPTRLGPYQPDNPETTTSGTFDTLWRAELPEVWEDAVWMRCVAATESGTTYDVRFALFLPDTGTPFETRTITGLTNTSGIERARKFLIPYGGAGEPNRGDRLFFAIQARITAGTGSARMNLASTHVGALADLPPNEN